MGAGAGSERHMGHSLWSQASQAPRVPRPLGSPRQLPAPGCLLQPASAAACPHSSPVACVDTCARQPSSLLGQDASQLWLDPETHGDGLDEAFGTCPRSLSQLHLLPPGPTQASPLGWTSGEGTPVHGLDTVPRTPRADAGQPSADLRPSLTSLSPWGKTMARTALVHPNHPW